MKDCQVLKRKIYRLFYNKIFYYGNFMVFVTIVPLSIIFAVDIHDAFCIFYLIVFSVSLLLPKKIARYPRIGYWVMLFLGISIFVLKKDIYFDRMKEYKSIHNTNSFSETSRSNIQRPIERGVMNAVGQVVPYEWNEWRKREEIHSTRYKKIG